MKNDILCLDFSTFTHIYSSYVKKVNCWDINFLDNSYNNLPFDYNTFFTLQKYLIELFKSIPEDNIYFIYHQSNILTFLNEEDENNIYNIDEYEDVEEVYFPIQEHNWVTEGFNINVISSYFWITQNEKTPKNPFTIKINDFDIIKNKHFDKLFICLSGQLIDGCNYKYYDSLVDLCSSIKNKEYKPLDDILTFRSFSKRNSNKKCMVSLLLKQDFINYIIALHYVCKKYYPEYDFLVFTNKTLSKKDISNLIFNDIKIENITTIEGDNSIYSYCLTDYKEAIFIEAGYIPINKIEYTENKTNSFSCIPSLEIKEYIKEKINNGEIPENNFEKKYIDNLLYINDYIKDIEIKNDVYKQMEFLFYIISKN